MKIIAEYDAYIYDGKSESIGPLIKWVNSAWALNADVKEAQIIDEWIVSFEYPNNDERVTVNPHSIIYKGPYGGFQVIKEVHFDNYPSLTLVK